MTQLTTTTAAAAPLVDEDAIRTYAGIYLLKKLDLAPDDGGLRLPLSLPSELTPLEDVLHDLHAQGLVAIDHRRERWELTRAGLAHLARLIDEAAELIDDLDELEVPEAIAELRARNLDVLRARFLWGWFDGEFDDLAEFQRARGVRPVQELWAYYLTDEDFYAELAKDLSE